MKRRWCGKFLGQCVVWTGLASTACCFSLAIIRPAQATELDLKTYNIQATPAPGPVTEFQPVEAFPPIPFALPFDWDADPYGDRNWRFNLHTLRIVDPALAAGDFDYAREVFLDWKRWHENCWWSWPLCFERAADFSWNDMATGIRASRLAYLLRARGRHDERLIELAEQHATILKDADFLASSNHALFQLHGLAALCLDHELPACAGVDAFIREQIAVVLRDQFAESGMHRENSPGYHFFVAGALEAVAPLLDVFSPDLPMVIERAENVSPWLVHPDGTTVLLGDSTATGRVDLPFPDGNPDCADVRSYGERPDCYLVKHFSDVGYLVVRSDWAIPAKYASMLFVRSGFFERSHRHADDFSFEWFERGHKILSDSGHGGYNRDKWDEYFDGTRAHNTIEVDDENFSIRPQDAYGNAVKVLKRTRDSVRIVMEVVHSSLGVEHRREIDYRPGEQLTVIDTLRSDRPGLRRYVQWHHFPKAFELTGGEGTFRADAGALVVEVAVSSTCGEGTTYQLVKGQVGPWIQGWASLANRERHPRWALGVVCEAENATFRADFTLQDPSQPAQEAAKMGTTNPAPQ